MANDDLVSDGALAKRVGVLERAAHDLYGLVLPRVHLRKACEPLMEAVGRLTTTREVIERDAQDDPDQLKFRSRVRREAFCTYTNTYFYPFDPRAEEVKHEDIVQGLLHTGRYGGHTSRFISVAEHSVKVAAMAEHLIMLDVRAGRVKEECAFVAALYGLMHDAHESYLGDIKKPMKACIMHVMGEPWEVIEGRVQAVIMDAYAIAPAPPEVEEAVKLADGFALYCEALVLKPDADLSDPRWKGVRVPPPEVAAVGVVRREWPEWSKVRALYDGEVRRLVATVGGHIPGDRVSALQAMREAAARAIEEPIRKAAREAKSEGSWRSQVSSASIDIPPELMDEPEFRRDA